MIILNRGKVFSENTVKVLSNCAKKSEYLQSIYSYLLIYYY